MIELPDGSVSSVGSRTSMYAPQPFPTSGALSQNLPLFWGRAKGNLLPWTLGCGGKQVTRLGRVHRASKSASSPLFYPTHCKNRELFKLPVFLFGNLGYLYPLTLVLYVARLVRNRGVISLCRAFLSSLAKGKMVAVCD